MQIIKKTGKSLFDTQLIKGIIVDKEVVNPDMPKRVSKAKIALLDCALEIEKTEPPPHPVRDRGIGREGL